MDWDPTQFFRTDAPPSPFALLVLNQPINEKAFLVLRERGTLALTTCLLQNTHVDEREKQTTQSAPTAAQTASTILCGKTALNLPL